jgi:hypothetical protein
MTSTPYTDYKLQIIMELKRGVQFLVLLVQITERTCTLFYFYPFIGFLLLPATCLLPVCTMSDSELFSVTEGTWSMALRQQIFWPQIIYPEYRGKIPT